MLFSGFDFDYTVSRIRPLVSTDRGAEFLDYEQGTATPVEDAVVAPVTGAESLTPGRDATMAQFSVTDTTSPKGFWETTDLVEIDGIRYQIEGHIQEWPSVTGDLSHAYLLVNRWEG